jgi:hypothetical protein
MKLIFLDIDGVLNSVTYAKARYRAGETGWDQIDPAAITRLNRAVEYSGAKIVISSSWRKGFHFMVQRGAKEADLGEWLRESKGLRADVIGMTPEQVRVEGRRSYRGDEIQAYLDGLPEQPEAVAILDDDSDMLHLYPWLVWCPNETGLGDREHDELLRMLRQPPPPPNRLLQVRRLLESHRRDESPEGQVGPGQVLRWIEEVVGT